MANKPICAHDTCRAAGASVSFFHQKQGNGETFSAQDKMKAIHDQTAPVSSGSFPLRSCTSIDFPSPSAALALEGRRTIRADVFDGDKCRLESVSVPT